MANRRAFEEAGPGIYCDWTIMWELENTSSYRNFRK